MDPIFPTSQPGHFFGFKLHIIKGLFGWKIFQSVPNLAKNFLLLPNFQPVDGSAAEKGAAKNYDGKEKINEKINL